MGRSGWPAGRSTLCGLAGGRTTWCVGFLGALGCGALGTLLGGHLADRFGRLRLLRTGYVLAIPSLIANRPLLRGLTWMLFGMVLAWYASTYPLGNWAS